MIFSSNVYEGIKIFGFRFIEEKTTTFLHTYNLIGIQSQFQELYAKLFNLYICIFDKFN